MIVTRARLEEEIAALRRAVDDPRAGIHGTSYRANDPHALMWVHATLVDTSVRIYELVVHRLSDAEKEQHYQESKRFARLFGIPDALLPRSARRLVGDARPDRFGRALQRVMLHALRPTVS